MNPPLSALQTGGKRLLLAGFGGLLLLLLVSGGDALLVLRQVRANESGERNLYLRRAEALDRVRNGIYQTAIVMRAYLLTQNPQDAAAQLTQWRIARENTDAALEECRRVLDGADATELATLRAEVAVYWKQLEFLPTIPDRDRLVLGGEYLNREVVRRRGATLDLVDRIDQMNARQMSAGDAQLSRTFDQLRLRLVLMLAATVLAGVLLAAFTVRRTLRLEEELQERYDEGVRTRQELQELSARLVSAQEEERRAISRELHDEVGQSLSALLMEAGNAAAQLPAASGNGQSGATEIAQFRRHVDSIKKLAEASVGVIRNMTLLLRPSMLDDLGLLPALEWQAREVSKRTGLRVQVSADDTTEELPDELRTCIYRVVQEALHNCARHAQARTVKVVVGHVVIDHEPRRIVLTVEDDGRGFDSRRVRGLGLVGMEERVNHLGGAFAVKSVPGSGTRVEVELPLAG